MAVSHALQNLAGRGARARRPAAAGRRLGADGVESRPGNLYAARPAQLAPARRRDQAPPPEVRSPPLGHLHPRLPPRPRARAGAVLSRAAGRVPREQRRDGRRSPLARDRPGCERRAHRQPARQSSTSTGRPSTRSSTGRWSRRSARAPASCKREVLPRREAVLAIASQIRRSEQRQPRHPARRGHPASGGVPHGAAPAHLGQPLLSASSSRSRPSSVCASSSGGRSTSARWRKRPST